MNSCVYDFTCVYFNTLSPLSSLTSIGQCVFISLLFTLVAVYSRPIPPFFSNNFIAIQLIYLLFCIGVSIPSAYYLGWYASTETIVKFYLMQGSIATTFILICFVSCCIVNFVVYKMPATNHAEKVKKRALTALFTRMALYTFWNCVNKVPITAYEFAPPFVNGYSLYDGTPPREGYHCLIFLFFYFYFN